MVRCLSRRRNPFLSELHLNQTVVRRNIFSGHGGGNIKHIIKKLFCVYFSISAIHENAESDKHPVRTTIGIMTYRIR